jgi:hypothetical protein
MVVDVESLAGRSTLNSGAYSGGAPSISSRGMGGWWGSDFDEDEEEEDLEEEEMNEEMEEGGDDGMGGSDSETAHSQWTSLSARGGGGSTGGGGGSQARQEHQSHHRTHSHDSHTRTHSQDLSQAVCTFTSSGSTFMDQHWYFCYTCDLTVTKGCCSVCARTCHAGHKVSARV